MNIPNWPELPNKLKSERSIAKNYPEFYEYIISSYPKELTFEEKIYWYYNRLSSHPICVVCGAPTKYDKYKRAYRDCCSSKCSNRNPNKLEKIKQTNLERYGVERYVNIEKCKQTNLERYGSESPLGSSEIQFKSKSTKSKLHGDEYYTNRNKCKQTKLERYGDEYYNNSEQSKQTKLERYGDPGYNNRELAKLTCFNRYGVSHYTNSNQAKLTSLERYGAEYPMQNDNIKSKALDNYRKNFINIHPNILGYTDCGSWIISCPHTDCDKCQDKTFESTPRIYRDRIRLGIESCTKLLPEDNNHIKNTTIEQFTKDILDSSGVSYIENDRTILSGKELDIYIPSSNLAIECNGVFFHSTRMKESNYHKNKYIECERRGVQLISIWEDWIKNKPEIVKSLILSKLGKYERRLWARKCNITTLKSDIANAFFVTNHIQGKTNSSIYIGLYYDEELVSVMSFGKKRGMMGNNVRKSEIWELSRFCSKLNTQVIGAADKLLKYFISQYHPSQIYSFSSNDISNGSLYKKLGFSGDNKINQSYWYIDPTTFRRYHRSSFSKYNIVRLGWQKMMSSDWTESEIMYKHGFLQIYDSGQRKWIYENKKENR